MSNLKLIEPTFKLKGTKLYTLTKVLHKQAKLK